MTGRKRKLAREPIRTLYDHAPAPKYLIRLRKTDHMTVSDLGVLLSNPMNVGPIFYQYSAEVSFPEPSRPGIIKNSYAVSKGLNRTGRMSMMSESKSVS